jgi:hypothetical protein
MQGINTYGVRLKNSKLFRAQKKELTSEQI